uniref:Uncharacterized protein n=1 Tax=Lactuca sativa TaxID=4236 RepID=A0A9R1WYQ9_LACSA|nr:hypothetical protein LSAT_V11C800389790 [Lactuca sativa]
MHVPNGDPLLVHLMMLHEVRSQEVFETGRFLFKIQGMQLDFDETRYILISGLRRSIKFKSLGSVVPRHYKYTFAAQRFRRLHYVFELFGTLR